MHHFWSIVQLETTTETAEDGKQYARAFEKKNVDWSHILSGADLVRISNQYNNVNFKSRNGEHIFNFISKRLVYTKGEYENFRVTQVIEIDVSEESLGDDRNFITTDTNEHDIKKELIDYEQDPRWNGFSTDEFLEARIRNYHKGSGGEVIIRIHGERDIVTIKTDDDAETGVSVEQTFRDSNNNEGRGDNLGKSERSVQHSRNFGTDLVQEGDRAVFSADRLSYLIDDSGAGSRTDYARKWATSINPTDFINLTIGKEYPERCTIFGALFNRSGKCAGPYPPRLCG